jgi:hypothetical protein
MGQHGTVATRLHPLQELGYATDLDVQAHYVIQPGAPAITVMSRLDPGVLAGSKCILKPFW